MSGLAVTLLALGTALAARPDEGGGFRPYDDADVLDHVDGPLGLVRVHYSVDGPNVTILDDLDGSGAPDFPELVAATAEGVLDGFVALGFREPVSEESLGIDDLGGSGAFDFYLVDFGGTADGQFSVDDCAGGVCVGHMLMENDFSGYGYSSLEEAASVLTSHELFHAVQAAYAARLPAWMSEGMAVWAERRFDEDSPDFMGLSSAYLAEPTRPVNSPPAGTVTAWVYGTALFFEFVTLRHGLDAAPDVLVAMESTDEDDALDAVLDVLQDRGDSLADAWPVFAAWNLGTGRRSGALDGYPFAHRLGTVPMEGDSEGGLLEDDNRFYPVATTYWRFTHAGGPLSFVAEDDPTGLVFGLHPIEDGSENGPALDALVTWAPTSDGAVDLGDVDAGHYYVLGTYPAEADESAKVHFCLADPDAAAVCMPAVDEGPDDTGEPSTEEDDDPAEQDEDTPTDGAGTSKDDSGCSTAAGSAQGLLALLGLGLAWRRRP